MPDTIRMFLNLVTCYYTSITTGNTMGLRDVLVAKKSPTLLRISSFTYDQLMGFCWPWPDDFSIISIVFLRVWLNKSFDSRKYTKPRLIISGLPFTFPVLLSIIATIT